MMKEIAWNMFKNTGNIDTFLELRQIEQIENDNVQNIHNQNISQPIIKDSEIKSE